MEKKFILNGVDITVTEFKQTSEGVSFKYQGKSYSFSLVMKEDRSLILDDGEKFRVTVGSANKDGESIVMAKGREARISLGGLRIKKNRAHTGGLTSPMPGKIFKVLKEVGSEVKKGEPILILEAMKMEHPIRSDKDGKVKKIAYKVGELVQGGVSLAEVE